MSPILSTLHQSQKFNEMNYWNTHPCRQLSLLWVMNICYWDGKYRKCKDLIWLDSHSVQVFLNTGGSVNTKKKGVQREIIHKTTTKAKAVWYVYIAFTIQAVICLYSVYNSGIYNIYIFVEWVGIAWSIIWYIQHAMVPSFNEA